MIETQKLVIKYKTVTLYRMSDDLESFKYYNNSNLQYSQLFLNSVQSYSVAEHIHSPESSLSIMGMGVRSIKPNLARTYVIQNAFC